MPERLSCNLAFSSPMHFWETLKKGLTFLAKNTPETRISGIGKQVMSASRQFMESRIASTPAKVTRLVISSGMMCA